MCVQTCLGDTIPKKFTAALVNF